MKLLERIKNSRIIVFRFLLNPQIIQYIVFLSFTLIIILPALIYHYVYPNLSDDTANHLISIERMISGDKNIIVMRYMAYVYIGYPMYYLSQLFHISMISIFNWVNILTPLMVGFTLYYVFNELIGRLAGYIAMIVPLFVSGTMLYYQYFGIVFDLINIGVLYPLLILFSIRWLQQRRIYQLVLTLIFSLLTVTFHTNGIYLIFITLLSAFIYVIYRLIKKQRKNILSPIIIGFSVFSVSFIGLWLFMPYSLQQFKYLFFDMTPSELIGSRINGVYQALLPFHYYISMFVGLGIILISIVAIYLIRSNRIKINDSIKILLYVFSCWVILMLVVAYGHLSTIPLRQQLDAAIVLSFICITLIGVVLTYNKKYLPFVLALVIIGSYPQFIPQWFMDNSAVKTADKQAMNYLNTLDNKYYNCSIEVAPWIYDSFVKEQYSSSYMDLIIIRNIGMTQSCDVKSVFYDGHGVEINDNYELLQKFNDGKVIVSIYGRIG